MNKPLLLLVALTFCCCIASLHGFAINTCRCRRMVANPVPPRAVKKIEVTAASGHCPRTEITITVRNGNRICVDPEAKWFPGLLNTLQKKNAVSTPESRTASTPSF
uniref:C-X-C motif chemokine 10 n=1 Tax=Oreochromis niloticus TaxID=8128 RepID=A0A669EFP8_ORENI